MCCVISSRRRRLGRRGTAALEFALVGSAFCLLMIAIMDLGRFYATLHSLRTVTGKAARAALVDPLLSGCSAPALLVASGVPFLQPSLLTLCVTQANASGVTRITVTASYPFSFILPNWVASGGTLTDSIALSY